MSGSGRGILVAALFGLIAFTAVTGYLLAASSYPKAERYPTYTDTRHNSGDTNAAAPAQDSGAPQNKQPCRNPESREESDLCAQWEAANAAKGNVLWTERHFWIGLVTTFGLAITVILTLRAVRASERSLEQSKIEHRAQFRPYVYVTRIRAKKLDDGRWRIKGWLVNNGAVHAQQVSACMAIEYFELPMPRERPITEAYSAFPYIRPHGGKTWISRIYNLTEDQEEAIRDFRAVLWVALAYSFRPFSDVEPNSFVYEVVFVGPDLDSRSSRIIPEWVYREPHADEEGQEQLSLAPPEDGQEGEAPA